MSAILRVKFNQSSLYFHIRLQCIYMRFLLRHEINLITFEYHQRLEWKERYTSVKIKLLFLSCFETVQDFVRIRTELWQNPKNMLDSSTPSKYSKHSIQFFRLIPCELMNLVYLWCCLNQYKCQSVQLEYWSMAIANSKDLNMH